MTITSDRFNEWMENQLEGSNFTPEEKAAIWEEMTDKFLRRQAHLLGARQCQQGRC